MVIDASALVALLAMEPNGNALPDAWLAAAVQHLDEHLVSFDRDFKQRLSRGQFTLLAAS